MAHSEEDDPEDDDFDPEDDDFDPEDEELDLPLEDDEEFDESLGDA